MMRSLYSAVSGLHVHQTKMDVLANNISNVNTTGFKKGQVTFQEVLNQTIKPAQQGVNNGGGINAQQVGLGVALGSITNIQTQGAPSTTGNSTDLMIQGEGYFVLTDGDNHYFTRAGTFCVDNNNYLVNSANGMIVCDEDGDPIELRFYGGNISVAADGTIAYMKTNGQPATYGDAVGLATFSNYAGLLKMGENMYVESPASGTANLTSPGDDSAGILMAGFLEMSNVDLAQEFVDMIIAERGFQANSKSIRTADEMLQELITMKR